MKLKDACFGRLMDDSAEKAVATKENQVLREFSESEAWSNHQDEVTGELVAHKNRAEKPAASSISEISGNPKAERRKWPQKFLHILGSRVLQGRSLFDCEKDLDVNADIW